MVIVAWPSRSCTIFGWTPALNNREACVWRSSCNVSAGVPVSFANLRHTRVHDWVRDSGEMSKIRPECGKGRRSSCVKTDGDTTIVRDFPDFGDDSTRTFPRVLVCTSVIDLFIVTVFLSTSMSLHLRPQISDRRRPPRRASIQAALSCLCVYAPSSSDGHQSMNSETIWASHTLICRCSWLTSRCDGGLDSGCLAGLAETSRADIAQVNADEISA